MRQRICTCGHSSERHAPDCDVCGYNECPNFTKSTLRGCIGCLVDAEPHTCGFTAFAIPRTWRRSSAGAVVGEQHQVTLVKLIAPTIIPGDYVTADMPANALGPERKSS